MRRTIYTLLSVIFLIFIRIAPVNAELIYENFNGIIYVKQATVEELENLFKKYHYTRFRGLKNYHIPAILINNMPTDYREIKSAKYRNELFIRMLTPLALKINEEISNERHSLLRLERAYNRNKKLNPTEMEKLEKLALKYDYFVRSKDPEVRIPLLLLHLKTRINIIPPSIFVAAAAIETDWGMSRIVHEANSLYKEKVWYTDEGLEPLENKDDGYRFKIFERLIDSMRSYAITFNSNTAYFNAWKAREEAIERQDKLIGESIAYSLSLATNLPNYVGILDYTTAFYDLLSIDNGNLTRISE